VYIFFISVFFLFYLLSFSNRNKNGNIKMVVIE
jgi:hypothetical protein